MSTSEAQIMARALYDSVLSAMLSSLRGSASRFAAGNTVGQPEQALPADAPPQVRNFVALLARDGQLSKLPAVVSALEQYAASQSTVMSGEVVSATELDAAQQGKIIEQLRASYGERLDLHFSVDPSILGGLVIHIGDQVFDNSARTRLSAVQRSMQSS